MCIQKPQLRRNIMFGFERGKKKEAKKDKKSNIFRHWTCFCFFFKNGSSPLFPAFTLGTFFLDSKKKKKKTKKPKNKMYQLSKINMFLMFFFFWRLFF